MDINEQVVSLGIAKRMKELGFKQKGIFVWSRRTKPLGHSEEEFEVLPRVRMMVGTLEEYQTYTVAELGEMLPSGYMTVQDSGFWVCWTLYSCPQIQVCGDNTEADARAKMLIYLKEQEVI